MKAAFYTLGCKVNQYDAAAMQNCLEQAGFVCVDFTQRADVYVVVTCTVTETADKKSRQMLSRAKRNNPEALIVAAGCYAQSQKQELAQRLGVDLIVGNSERNKIAELIEQAMKTRLCAARELEDNEPYEELDAASFEGKNRAFLKIQEGCNNYCTYCIIPFVRGNERSLSLEGITRQASKLGKAGYPELVLTGINLTAYGTDFKNGTDLADAVAAATIPDEVKRVRLGSIDVPVMNEGFVSRLAQNKKMCPHFHISLQSGSDRILAAMNRHYTTEEYAAAVELLRGHFDRPWITTDIIVGFPGETEADFELSCQFVRRIGFGKVHVFPYSRRKGTLAADMKEQIPETVKHERVLKLTKIADETAREQMKNYLGATVTLLGEKDGEGYTQHYIRAEAEGLLPGELTVGRVTAVDGDSLIVKKL